MAEPVLFLADVERLAEELLTALPHKGHSDLADYLREQVTSDLAGLRCRWFMMGDAYRVERNADARRYSDNLRRADHIIDYLYNTPGTTT